MTHGLNEKADWNTLQGTIISPQNGILKMIFLFPRWDMLIPWRVCVNATKPWRQCLAALPNQQTSPKPSTLTKWPGLFSEITAFFLI